MMEASAERYRWEKVENESLTLVGPWGILWRINFGATLTKPCLHPLQTADGRCLTQFAPPDHPWHYGLWQAWKFIDRLNYWEEDRKTRRAEGSTRLVEAKILRADATGAQVVLRLAYHPAELPDAIVMEDEIALGIELPRADGSYRIKWEHTSRARRPLVLDRTPPPGQPEGKDWGGYAGLSFRGDRYLRAATVRLSTGPGGLDGNRRPARWVAMTGETDGRPAGLAIFDHPSNPRHPTPWYLVLRPSRANSPPAPFWYINAAFLHDAAYELHPDRPLKLRYLLRIDDTPPATAALEEEFSAFASPAPVTPETSR